MSHPYDLIIVGAGAGGGALAWRLATTGLRILVLEQGDPLPREPENHDPREVFLKARYQTREPWFDGRGHRFQPELHDGPGGNTKAWGATVYRFRQRDFEEIVHDGGISPAWPITYDDLKPYYREAEHLYQVHGTRGADPTEPPEDEPFPHEALPHEPRIQELSDALERVGCRPFPLPMAFPVGHGRPEEVFRRFDGYPDPRGLKVDAETATIEPLRNASNVEVRTGMTVVRIVASSSGLEVNHLVVCDADGRTHRLQAHQYILSCSAYRSAALLLRSADDRHPQGMANSSGLVGRFAMRHICSAYTVVFDRPNLSTFQKTLGLNDYYFGDGFDRPMPLGQMHLMGRADRTSIQTSLPEGTTEAERDEIVDNGIGIFLVTEDLPDPENRITADDEGIRLKYRAINMAAHERLVAELSRLMRLAEGVGDRSRNPRLVGGLTPFGAIQHQCGTVRFGRDPGTSVLDVDCKAHDLDNLYVVDSGFFPSSTASNPGLTIVANALRVGDRIAERFNAGGRIQWPTTACTSRRRKG